MSRLAHTPAGAIGIGPEPSTPRAAHCRSWNMRALIGAIGGLLLLFPAAASHAQERIGRLFSSPDERLELDRLRDAPDSEKAPEPAAPDESGPEPGSRQGAPALAVRLDGIVLRGGVHRVSWINGEMTGMGTVPSGGFRIDPVDLSGGQVRIRLPDGRSTVHLKPGQEIAAARSKLLEVYERRLSNVAAPVSGDRVPDSGKGKLSAGCDAGKGSAPLSISTPARFATAGVVPSISFLARSGASGTTSSIPASKRSVATDSVPPDLLSPPTLPENLVQELLRKARADSAPRAAASSGKPPAGGG